MQEYKPEIVGVWHTEKNLQATMKLIDELSSEGVKTIGFETESDLKRVQKTLYKLIADPSLSYNAETFLKFCLAHLRPSFKYWKKAEAYAREKGLKTIIIDSEYLHAVDDEMVFRNAAKKFNLWKRPSRVFWSEVVKDAPTYIRFNLRNRAMKRNVLAQKPQAIIVGLAHAVSLADALKMPLNKITLIMGARIMRPPKSRLTRGIYTQVLGTLFKRKENALQMKREAALARRRALRRP